jgi:hypothetical protein
VVNLRERERERERTPRSPRTEPVVKPRRSAGNSQAVSAPLSFRLERTQLPAQHLLYPLHHHSIPQLSRAMITLPYPAEALRRSDLVAAAMSPWADFPSALQGCTRSSNITGLAACGLSSPFSTGGVSSQTQACSPSSRSPLPPHLTAFCVLLLTPPVFDGAPACAPFAPSARSRSPVQSHSIIFQSRPPLCR